MDIFQVYKNNFKRYFICFLLMILIDLICIYIAEQIGIGYSEYVINNSFLFDKNYIKLINLLCTTIVQAYILLITTFDLKGKQYCGFVKLNKLYSSIVFKYLILNILFYFLYFIASSFGFILGSIALSYICIVLGTLILIVFEPTMYYLIYWKPSIKESIMRGYIVGIRFIGRLILLFLLEFLVYMLVSVIFTKGIVFYIIGNLIYYLVKLIKIIYVMIMVTALPYNKASHDSTKLI